MRRRQPLKSSAAFCVKSASYPPTELSPGLVLPVLRQVFGEYGKKSTCVRHGSRLLRPVARQARARLRRLRRSATKASGGRGAGGFCSRDDRGAEDRRDARGLGRVAILA